MSATAIVAIVLLVVAAAWLNWRFRKRQRPVPPALRRGRSLPDFAATDEAGNPVHSTEIRGTAAVFLFVRGNWCPFCNRQVRNLTLHYKAIVDLGARLILVTPKPLETTRRVAEFFDVEFDFWLDENLQVARELGLLQSDGVPKDHQNEYGEDTVWPTTLVVDRNGIIRYAELSRFIADRPDPETLVNELKLALQH